jgi:type III secretory pathway component EscT
MTDVVSALAIAAPFIALFARLAPFAIVLPLLGARVLPLMPRVALVAVLAVGIAPSALATAHAGPFAFATLVLAVVQNLATGTVLALVVGLPFFALEHGAHAIDAARGALTLDDRPDDEASPLASVVRWTFLATFVAAGGLRATLRIVAASLASFPLMGPVRGDPRFVDLAARFSADALAGSVTSLSAVWLSWAAVEIVFALVARLAPPWSESAVPLPARTLVPLAAVALTVAAWSGAGLDLARVAFSAARAFVR